MADAQTSIGAHIRPGMGIYKGNTPALTPPGPSGENSLLPALREVADRLWTPKAVEGEKLPFLTVKSPEMEDLHTESGWATACEEPMAASANDVMDSEDKCIAWLRGMDQYAKSGLAPDEMGLDNLKARYPFWAGRDDGSKTSTFDAHLSESVEEDPEPEIPVSHVGRSFPETWPCDSFGNERCSYHAIDVNIAKQLFDGYHMGYECYHEIVKRTRLNQMCSEIPVYEGEEDGQW